MNRLTLVLALATAAAVSLHAVERFPKGYKPLSEMTPEEQQKFREGRARQTGGFLTIKGAGHVSVLNAQTQFGEADLEDAFSQLRAFIRGFNIDFRPAAFTIQTAREQREKAGAGACVFLIDDPALPVSLVAIEEGWGTVNVAALREGNPNAERLAARFKKEFIRVSSIVFSGAQSQYKTSPMQCVTSVAKLDKTVGEKYGVDTLTAIGKHLPELGVIHDQTITYREACRRGIAPQPTNEFQKAIWEQVHAIPSDPIKIKYDPKRDK